MAQTSLISYKDPIKYYKNIKVMTELLTNLKNQKVEEKNRAQPYDRKKTIKVNQSALSSSTEWLQN